MNLRCVFLRMLTMLSLCGLCAQTPALWGAVSLDSSAGMRANKPHMRWWDEARFGLFIHWGVYAVHGNVWQGEPLGRYGHDSTWLLQRVPLPVLPYKNLTEGFTAAQYDPVAWAQLARDAGMRYVVLTSKHHEGFALWPTQTGGWNVMDSPARRDLIGPLADAVRAQGLKFGLYYSQSQDWTHPGGAKRNPRRAIERRANLADGEGWDDAHKGSYQRYLDTLALPQVNELLARYQPDILWWDTPVDMTPERVEVFTNALKLYPEIITNNRLASDHSVGDFVTPEQFVPPEGLPNKYFEVCMTMNDSWGYTTQNDNWKSTEQLLKILSDTASKGGNFLLNVGPTPDGRIPEASIERLREMGKWMAVNGEAIYGTQAGPYPRPLPWGRITRKLLPEGGERWYVHIWDWPADGKLFLPALGETPVGAHLLADASLPVGTLAKNGGIEIALPAQAVVDPTITVLSLDFEAPVAVSMPAYMPAHANGSFVLRPEVADRYGSTAGVMQVKGQGESAAIVDWFEARWYVGYRIDVEQSGRYRVEAQIATNKEVAIQLRIDGKTKAKATLPDTGGLDCWQKISLGELSLPQGDIRFEIRPDAAKPWSPIALKTVRLIPIKSPDSTAR